MKRVLSLSAAAIVAALLSADNCAFAQGCGRNQAVQQQQQPAQVIQVPSTPVEASQSVRKLSAAPVQSSTLLATNCPNCQAAARSDKLAQFTVPPSRYATQSVETGPARLALSADAGCSSCQKKALQAPPPEPQPAAAVQTVNTQSKVKSSPAIFRSTSFHPLEKLRDAVSGKGTIRQTQVIKPDGTVIQRERTS